MVGMAEWQWRMKEPGAKVMLYELPNDGPLDWDEVKKRRLNMFTGVGAGASQEGIGKVVNFFQNIQGAAGPDNRDKNVLAIMTKVDNLSWSMHSSANILYFELVFFITESGNEEGNLVTSQRFLQPKILVKKNAVAVQKRTPCLHSLHIYRLHSYIPISKPIYYKIICHL